MWAVRFIPLVAFFVQAIHAEWPDNPSQAVNYLMRYGYLQQGYTTRSNPRLSLEKALSRFQHNSHLNISGEMDRMTMAQMRMKRCGVADVLPRRRRNPLALGFRMHHHHSKRFALQGSKWRKAHLTYRFRNSTPDLPIKQVYETIKKAFETWSKVTPLKFTRVYNKLADIDVEFQIGSHGDGDPFDGPGHILAHAYFPESNTHPINGDVHFDDDETWIVGSDPQNVGTSLLCTAIHEFGHSLGLSHSYESDAIMWPYDKKCNGGVLSNDDIHAIQTLYGTPNASLVPTKEQITRKPRKEWETTTKAMLTNNETTSTSKEEEICRGFIDAVTRAENGIVYAFRKSWVVLVYKNQIARNLIKLIKDVFPEAPSSVDAAFTADINQTTFTYLIKDNLVWKYSYNKQNKRFKLAPNYPMKDWCKYCNLNNTINAAFTTDMSTYLISGDEYEEIQFDKRSNIFISMSKNPTYSFPGLNMIASDVHIDATYVSSHQDLQVMSGKKLYEYEMSQKHFLVITKFTASAFLGCKKKYQHGLDDPDYDFTDYHLVNSSFNPDFDYDDDYGHYDYEYGHGVGKHDRHHRHKKHHKGKKHHSHDHHQKHDRKNKKCHKKGHKKDHKKNKKYWTPKKKNRKRHDLHK